MSIRSKFFLKWGNNLFRDNEPELALNMFNKAINADSRDLNAYIAKVGVLTRIGRVAEALNTLDEAIETNNNSENINEIIEIKRLLSDFVNKSK